MFLNPVVAAEYAQPGDAVTGIPAILKGQLARVVEVRKVLRDIRLAPQVDLDVELPGQFGVWTFRMDANTELGLVEAAGGLAGQLGEILRELAG